MGFLDFLKAKPAAPVTATATQERFEPPRAQSVTVDPEKSGGPGNNPKTPGEQPTFNPYWNSNDPERASSDSDSDDDLVHKNAQWGVQKAEAMCQAWGKKSLYGTYAIIWCLYFIDALEGTATSLMQPYVLSDFLAHSLVAVTPILASVIGGVWRAPLAKIMDIWGRPEAFAIMVVAMTVGQIMIAGSQGPKTYAAAEVFNQLGGNGRAAVLGVIVADTSALKARGLMFAFIASPYIITSWIAGEFANTFLTVNWRWAFGTWAIIHPITSLPLFLLLKYNCRKAEKMGLMPTRVKSGRTFMQSFKYYAIEYDFIGLFLLCSGLAIFLLPFSIVNLQSNGWNTPFIIAMVVVGAVTLVGFGVYEAFFAPVMIFPWALLKNRTILGANILAAVLFIEFYLWNNYFFSFLPVVVGTTTQQTGYIANIYSVGSCAWSFIAGAILYKTGGFKMQSLFFGWPVTALGVGLMIYFRQPDVNAGYIVMCQIFIAIGGGTLVIAEQVAGMAATTHQFVAIVLAIQGMSSQVGGAIGSVVAANIWQANFPDRLREYLPQEAQANATEFNLIYQDITTQLGYIGTPTGDAIVQSYGDTQRLMCAAATGILALALVAILMWQNIDTRARKQVKGVVF